MMNRNLSIRTLMLTAILLLGGITGGCARYSTTARPDFMEMGAEGILQYASDQAGSLSSLLSSGTLQIRFQRGGLSARCAILYVQPDSIRLDVSAALGTTLLQAVMAGPYIQAYVPLEKTVVSGTMVPGEVFEFGGIPLELDSLKQLVLGPALAFNWVDLAASIDQLDIGPNQILVGIPRPGGFRLLLTLDTHLQYQKEVLIDPRGRVLLEIYFSDYDRVSGVLLPGKVRLVYPDSFLELTFEASRQKVDSPHSAGDFVLDIPAGVRHLPLVPPPGSFTQR